MNHWNEFTIGATTKGNYAKRASLTWQGIISLNGRILEQMGNPTHVILYFDKPNSMIGAKAAAGDREHAIPLKTWGQGATRIIRAKKFCDYHNIKLKRTVIFDEPLIDDGMLVLDLRRTHLSPRLSAPELEEESRLQRARLAEQNAPPPYQRMFPRERASTRNRDTENNRHISHYSF